MYLNTYLQKKVFTFVFYLDKMLNFQEWFVFYYFCSLLTIDSIKYVYYRTLVTYARIFASLLNLFL